MTCQIQDELLFLAAFQIHYSHWLCTVIGCDQYSQFTVGFATQPKAVLSTAKIFAVYRVYKRKVDKPKNWLFIKDPQFFLDHYETLAKLLTHEVITLTIFHGDWVKIVDFFIISQLLGLSTFFLYTLYYTFEDMASQLNWNFAIHIVKSRVFT